MLSRQGHGKSLDWYIMGVVFFEMLTGLPPYYSKNQYLSIIIELIYTLTYKMPIFNSQNIYRLIANPYFKDYYKKIQGADLDHSDPLKLNHINFSNLLIGIKFTKSYSNLLKGICYDESKW
jgi:serine/threonine protein kinase